MADMTATLCICIYRFPIVFKFFLLFSEKKKEKVRCYTIGTNM